MEQNIIQALIKLKIPYEIDATCSSISSAKKVKTGVAVVTSRRAIYNYDNNHPERVICILVKCGSFIFVCVNNREYDAESCISTWYKRDVNEFVGDATCDVCTRFSGNIGFHACFICNYHICRKCMMKIQIDESAHQCPQCRQWILSDEGYGTRFDGNQIQIALNNKHPVDKLMFVLSKLDGAIDIQLRINRIFYPEIIDICRLSNTHRYSKNYSKKTRVGKLLRMMYEEIHKENLDLKIYITRRTFSIDCALQKPIKEVSVFDLSSDNLLQLSKNA